MQRTLFILAGLGALAAPLAAQTVRGRVVDARTGEGVPQAVVSALAASGNRRAGQARTDARGVFSMPMRAAGSVRLRVERTGYLQTLTEPMPVAQAETLAVELSVSSAPLTIAPLRVTARVEPPKRRNLELNGFYHRERLGIGQYVRREDIERRANANLAQVLARVPGARIRYRGPHQYIFFPRNGEPRMTQNFRGSPANECLPRLFVDGSRVTYDAMNDINSVVNPNQVEALEVFRGPSEIPVEFNDNNSTCGVILIWTRHEA